MKPNFALNLTLEGVGLYHRSPTGAWIEVGSVDLAPGPDDPAVREQLALLRKTAIALARGTTLLSKVVLPEAVVTYLTVESAGSPEEIEAQITAQLEPRLGLPPEELVFDWVPAAGSVQVAVAERAVVEEAETFAVTNRFNPVSIVAAPQPGYFEGEPLFRQTDFAASILGPGTEVERDPVPFAPTAPEDAPEEARLAGAVSDPAPAAGLDGAAAPGAVPGAMAGNAQDTSATRTGRPVHEPQADDGATRAGATVDLAAGASLEADDTDALGDGAADHVSDHPDGAAAPSGAGHQAAFAQHPGLAGHGTPAPEPGPGDDVADSVQDQDEPSFQSARAGRAAAPPPDPGAIASRRSPRFAVIPIADDPSAMDLPPPGLGDEAPAGKDRRRAAVKSGAAGKRAVAFPSAATALVARLRSRAGPGLAALIAAAGRLRPARGRPDGAASGAGAASSRAAIAEPILPPQATVRGPTGKRKWVAPAVTLAVLIAFGSGAAWLLRPPSVDPLAEFGPVTEDDMRIAAEATAATEGTTTADGQGAVPENGANNGTGDGTGDGTGAIADTGTAADPALRPAQRPETLLPDTAEAVSDPTQLTEEERQAILDAGLPLPGDSPADVEEPELQLSAEEIDAIWKETGIQVDVIPPQAPEFDELGEDIYLPNTLNAPASSDALALPDYGAGTGDKEPSRQRNPVGPGVAFDVDDRGLVKPTPEGALTPDGILVRAGKPAVLPPARPQGIAPQTADPLQGFRPRPRPEELGKAAAPVTGGRSREELARLRPRARPESPQALAAAAEAAGESPLAIVVSVRPHVRPEGFAQTVAKAIAERKARAQAASARPAPEAGTARQLPTRANVAREATIKHAINLHKINVIGVYGTPSARRALMRLPTGRYVKVKVGDRLAGGQIAAIGSDSVSYVKGGQAQILRVGK